MNYKIGQRDQAILAALARYGILSTQQIWNKFFSGVDKTTMRRRLRILEKRKLIRRSMPLDDGTNTWTLGFWGKNKLLLEKTNSYSNRNTIYHEVRLTDLRMKLEDMGLASDWTPEWKMKQEAFTLNYKTAGQMIIPDGLVIEKIDGSPKVIAVELELTAKSSKRYKNILETYSSLRHIDIVWYFVKSLKDGVPIEWAHNRVMQSALSRKSQLFFICDMHELLEVGSSARLFILGSKNVFKIKDINFDDLKREIKGANKMALGQSGQAAQILEGPKPIKPPQSHHNFKYQTAVGGRPLVPDHSPSTMESGQEREPVEEGGLGKNCDVIVDNEPYMSEKMSCWI